VRGARVGSANTFKTGCGGAAGFRGGDERVPPDPRMVHFPAQAIVGYDHLPQVNRQRSLLWTAADACDPRARLCALLVLRAADAAGQKQGSGHHDPGLDPETRSRKGPSTLLVSQRCARRRLGIRYRSMQACQKTGHTVWSRFMSRFLQARSLRKEETDRRSTSGDKVSL